MINERLQKSYKMAEDIAAHNLKIWRTANIISKRYYNTDKYHNYIHKNKHKALHMWAYYVKTRDRYTCQCCKRSDIILAAHHIKNKKQYPQYQYDVDNGITLCKICHYQFHSKYGKYKNNKEQLTEFTNNYKVAGN